MKTVVAVENKERSVIQALISDYSELVKARLTFLVLLTTLAGFYMGSAGSVDFAAMIHTVFATALVAAGAAALNQWMERSADALMPRTRNRPLPAGRMQPEEAFVFGSVVSLTGLIYLAVSVNAIASIVAGITLGSYLFVYTPLKRVTWLNTIIGAIPGALPPVIGWAGARGSLAPEAWILFAIIFFWQMPHFFAIAWIYREDYAQGGFRMLPLEDPDGVRTGRQSVIHAMLLMPISLLPWILGLAGPAYALVALLLGILFVGFAIRFQWIVSRGTAAQAQSAAWRLFGASILYLPLLFGMMTFDKLK